MTNNKKDIRWRQRFANLERALKQLNESLAIEEPSDTEKAGAIQFFELLKHIKIEGKIIFNKNK